MGVPWIGRGAVGDTRPRAGRVGTRARSAMPAHRPRQESERTSQVARPCTGGRWGATRYSSGSRGATAVRAGALELPANELIDTTFGCYPSSAQKPRRRVYAYA